MAAGDVNPLRPPTWLDAAIDQRLAFMAKETGLTKDSPILEPKTMIATPLTEPEPGQDYDEWDRQCDNCKTVVPEGEPLFAGRSLREFANGQPVTVTFGMCGTCKDLP
jgi:hypothetical protein